MQLRTLLLVLVSLLIGACGMKGDLYETTTPPAPMPAPEASQQAGQDQPGNDDGDSRKTIPATPPPELSR